MRKMMMAALTLLLLAGAYPAVAQDDGARPAPNILQIYREVVKPGRTAAHEKIEVGWPKAYKGSKNSAHYLGMTSVTGPSEAWFLSGYPSYEALEKQQKAEDSDAALSAELTRLATADGDVLDKTISITARFRPEISHRPPINIGAYRYMAVSTVRLRPGNVNKWVEMRKMIKAAHEKAGLKDYYSIFEVQSGMTGPVFLVLQPLKSLKEIDDAPALHESAAYREALGGEEADKKMAEIASAAVMSNENAVFAFNPKMSVPPPEYALADAGYWNPKPVMATTAKPKTTASAKKPQ